MLLFFSFPFTPFFLFFLLELRCFGFFFSFFSMLDFSPSILRGAEFVPLVFGLFSLFLIFWGLVFSLSLLRSPEQAAPK